ncbi:hypothetical protein [Candidatus Amarolinea aalborgensis]|uniref:hypothetical protein n=1 Tax=Candidatus Amarolinea aalborgensis TaxID=2249329 RepID=UPI003BF9AC0B
MSDIAIRVDNCILSRVEGLSKLYHIGRAQERHDTPSTRLRTGLGMRRTETCAELSRSIVAFAETCAERSRRIVAFAETCAE